MTAPQIQKNPPHGTPLEGTADAESHYLAAIGRTVRELRARRAMSRKVLAGTAQVSERYLAQLETGETNPSVILLGRVAQALGTSLVELLDTRDKSPEARMIERFLGQLPEPRLQEALAQLMRHFGQDEATRRQRIALVGLRGAGKSTLGRALAAETQAPFVELNAAIEQEAGIGLNEVFQLYGQSGYRRLERRALEKLIARDEQMIITVGGGIVSEGDTFNLLLMNCVTVWVKASPEEHMARVVAQGDLRPMEGSAEAMEDLRRILAAREALYSQADITLDTTGHTPAHSLAQLRAALNP